MPNYEPGDYVKAGFKDDRSGESEWMCVRVEFADESKRLVFGWLDSEPILNTDNPRVGQRLALSYDKIRQHKRASEFGEHWQSQQFGFSAT